MPAAHVASAGPAGEKHSGCEVRQVVPALQSALSLSCAVRDAALALDLRGLGGLSACDVTIKDGDIKNVSVRRGPQEWTSPLSARPGGVVEVVNGNGAIEVVAGAPGAVDIDSGPRGEGDERDARQGNLEQRQGRGVGRRRSHTCRHRFTSRAGVPAGSNRATRSRSRPTHGWR